LSADWFLTFYIFADMNGVPVVKSLWTEQQRYRLYRPLVVS